MSTPATDKAFTGSIPRLYETHLVPLIFEPYAQDLARRLEAAPATRLLEIAAGTGVVTRALAAVLPGRVAIVATDLNQAMLDHASSLGTNRPVEWRLADALRLPFDDETFDIVVCQFGVMFFPNRPKAYSEAHRVLKPGGVFVFSVWDRIAENEFAETVARAVESLFPDRPPRFLTRTPYGYSDHAAIARDLAAGRFSMPPRFVTVTARSRADSPRIPAVAFVEGTPLRNEIETIDASRLSDATRAAEEAIAMRFGSGPVDGKIQAHVVSVERRSS